MIWVQFQRAIFLSKLRLALPNMILFQNLIFPTLPSTAPDEYGSVSPLRTAAWSRSRPLAKVCRWGGSSVRTATILGWRPIRQRPAKAAWRLAVAVGVPGRA